jgi:hypothetical protein
MLSQRSSARKRGSRKQEDRPSTGEQPRAEPAQEVEVAAEGPVIETDPARQPDRAPGRSRVEVRYRRFAGWRVLDPRGQLVWYGVRDKAIERAELTAAEIGAEVVVYDKDGLVEATYTGKQDEPST